MGSTLAGKGLNYNIKCYLKEVLYEVRCLKSNEDMIMGSNPVESPEFFRFMRQSLKLSSKCEDHIFI